MKQHQDIKENTNMSKHVSKTHQGQGAIILAPT